MSIKDIVPWRRSKKGLTIKEEQEPFYTLQREVNNLFDRFFHGFDWLPSRFGGFEDRFSSFSPKVNIKDGKKSIEISAELPGMDEEDIDVSLSDNALTIKGEKKHEVEDNKEGYYRMERSFGSFYRSIPLPDGIDKDNVDAKLKKGVLKVTIPKTAKAIESQKKIEIKSG